MHNFFRLINKQSLLFLIVLTDISVCVKSSFADSLQRVLIIHSYHTEYFWTGEIKIGIDTILAGDEARVQIYHEFLDAKRLPGSAQRGVFLDYLESKYADIPLDAVLVTDDPALKLVRSSYHDSLFAGLPVIFAGVNRITANLLNTPWLTGVFENRDVVATVREAARQTRSSRVVILIDSTVTGQSYRKKLREAEKQYTLPEITFVVDVATRQISEHFQDIPSSVPVILYGQLRHLTPEGHLISWPLSSELLSQNIPNPIYSIATRTLNKGAIGGLMLDGRKHAEQAVGLLLQVLNGTPVQAVPEILKAENTWLFDAALLKAHRINTEKLPSNAVLINDELSFYARYKRLVWLTFAGFVASLAIIFLLAVIIRRGAATQRMLQENESRYKDLAYAGANVFWETDKDLKYCYMSGDTHYLYGLDHDRMIDRRIEDVFGENANFHFPWNEYHEQVSKRQPLDNLNFSLKHDGDNLRICQLNGKPIYDRNGVFMGYRGIKREVTEEHKLSETIAYQAAYDSLTGLINRREFNKQLDAYVDQSRQAAQESVLCFLDLDRFKLVNDTAGHLVGDALLTEIAQIFQHSLRQKDVIGRLGGDEFGFILVGTPISQAKQICNRLIKCVEDYRFRWNKRLFSVGVSVGMVSLLNDSKDAVELLSKADFACYKSKERGRGCLSVAGEDSDNDLIEDQKSLGYLANIAQAIEQQAFYLVKQPIKAIGTTEISHYELLLRYTDEDGQSIPPGLFIPQAERHGVITLIERWVMGHIFAHYYHYFPEGETVVSINLSGISIGNKEFVTWLKALINSGDIPPKYICFEVTETSAISQLSQAIEFMTDMRALGVRFALDDFGSGVASFGYLKQLPIDFLKIDGSLIRNIITEPSDQAIVKAVDSIAKMMGMKTIAEFVENEQIETLLQEMGVDYVQGYGIGKPVPCKQV